MSDHTNSPLRHALKQVAVTGTAGSLLLGVAVTGLAAPGSTAAPGTGRGTVTAAPAVAGSTAGTGTTSTIFSTSGSAGSSGDRAAAVALRTEQVASKTKRKRVNKHLLK